MAEKPQNKRWSGRRASSTKGYTWRHTYCPFCGLSYYRDLRLPFSDTFSEVFEIIKKEAAEREAVNDYSQPAHRGLVLGRAFEFKQELWEEHLACCEVDAWDVVVAAGLVTTAGAFRRLMEKIEGVESLFDYVEREQGEKP